MVVLLHELVLSLGGLVGDHLGVVLELHPPLVLGHVAQALSLVAEALRGLALLAIAL